MKKNGFTLIEILAVIAILAILVVLAVPALLETYRTAKMNAFTTELKLIGRAANQQWASEKLTNPEPMTFTKDGDTECSSHVDLMNVSDLSYYISIDGNGNIVKFYANNNEFQYHYDGSALGLEEIVNAQRLADVTGNNFVKITCSSAVLSSK